MNVIDRKVLPTRIPVTFIAIALLLLDRFNAPGLVWGIVCTLLALMLVGSLRAISQEKPVRPVYFTGPALMPHVIRMYLEQAFKNI